MKNYLMVILYDPLNRARLNNIRVFWLSALMDMECFESRLSLRNNNCTVLSFELIKYFTFY